MHPNDFRPARSSSFIREEHSVARPDERRPYPSMGSKEGGRRPKRAQTTPGMVFIAARCGLAPRWVARRTRLHFKQPILCNHPIPSQPKGFYSRNSSNGSAHADATRRAAQAATIHPIPRGSAFEAVSARPFPRIPARGLPDRPAGGGQPGRSKVQDKAAIL